MPALSSGCTTSSRRGLNLYKRGQTAHTLLCYERHKTLSKLDTEVLHANSSKSWYNKLSIVSYDLYTYHAANMDNNMIFSLLCSQDPWGNFGKLSATLNQAR